MSLGWFRNIELQIKSLSGPGIIENPINLVLYIVNKQKGEIHSGYTENHYNTPQHKKIQI